jgi:hypothetical protein
VADDGRDIDHSITITAARDDMSEEDTSDEPHDTSDYDAPLPPISKQYVSFAMSLLSEGLNFGGDRRILTEINVSRLSKANSITFSSSSYPSSIFK